MTRDVSRWMLVATLLAYVILAAAYSAAIVPEEASGEPWHYIYARCLADGRGLPPDSVARQVRQPPLYYLAAALVVRAAHPFCRNDPNTFMPVGDVEFPIPLSELRVLRAFSTLLGAGVIVLAYRLARRLAPGDPWMAILAPALVAFMPVFTTLCAMVTNDVAAALMVTLFFYALMRFLRSGDGRQLLAAVVLLGLATFTRNDCLVLLPLPLLAARWHPRREAKRPVVPPRLLAGALAAAPLLALVWFVAAQLGGHRGLVRIAPKPQQHLILLQVVEDPGLALIWLQVFVRQTLAGVLAPAPILATVLPMGEYRWAVAAAGAVVAAGWVCSRRIREGEPVWARPWLRLAIAGGLLSLGLAAVSTIFFSFPTPMTSNALVPLAAPLALVASHSLGALVPAVSPRWRTAGATAGWALLLAANVWFLHTTQQYHAAG